MIDISHKLNIFRCIWCERQLYKISSLLAHLKVVAYDFKQDNSYAYLESIVNFLKRVTVMEKRSEEF